MSSVPAGEDSYQAAVLRAAELVGGAVALSRRLQIPLDDLTQWMRGTSKPPAGIFLRLVDLVIEESRKASLVPGEPSPEKR